jgi:hypothetical protein
MMQIEVSQPAGDVGLIMVFDGLIDRSNCSLILSRLQNIWHKSDAGRTIGGIDFKTKATEDIHFSRQAFSNLGIDWDDQLNALEMHFIGGLSSAIAMYKQKYRHLDTWLNIRDTGFQVQKYHKNFGFYRPHVDSFPGHSPSDRVLASVTYLNDVEYGGETNFPLHNVKVKPKAGRIVLFPATWTHLHESCVPITDDKWIISSFIINFNDGMIPGFNMPSHNHDEHPHDDHSHNDHSHEENVHIENLSNDF